PGSMVGFDFARSFNPPSRMGTATGIVNAGGFTAALLCILLIGIVLDAVSGGNAFTPEAFRVAWTVQALFWTIGITGILVSRRKARRLLTEENLGVQTAPGPVPAGRTSE
ncbi:hypothetical protein ACFQ07_20155, partial [Actinomadura adrarensis]